jgi:hypothetical protein
MTLEEALQRVDLIEKGEAPGAAGFEVHRDGAGVVRVIEVTDAQARVVIYERA